MKTLVWLLVVVKLSLSDARRGPHHPRGEDPVEQKHHHYRPQGAEESLTGDTQLLHDTRHLQEDTKVYTKEQLDGMTSDELEFFYFNTHDFDHNNKLDGLELLKAVYHTMEHEDHDSEENSIEEGHNDMDTYIALVDRTLQTDDTDGDGFVSYAEYREGRAKRPRDRDDNTHGREDKTRGREDKTRGREDKTGVYSNNPSEEETLLHEHEQLHVEQVK